MIKNMRIAARYLDGFDFKPAHSGTIVEAYKIGKKFFDLTITIFIGKNQKTAKALWSTHEINRNEEEWIKLIDEAAKKQPFVKQGDEVQRIEIKFGDFLGLRYIANVTLKKKELHVSSIEVAQPRCDVFERFPAPTSINGVAGVKECYENFIKE